MKTMKNIIVALAGLLVIASCSNEVTPLASSISVDTEEMTFAWNASEAQSVNVKADGDWVITAPQWISVEPSAGNGDATVSISVKSENTVVSDVLACDREKFEEDYLIVEGAQWEATGVSGAKLEENKELPDSMYFSILHLNSYRSAAVNFEGNGVSAALSVTQEGDANWVSAAIKISVADFVALADDPTTWYELTGTVTNISNDYYGNFDLVDNTGSVYVYGIESSKGAGDKNVLYTLGINAGDEITIIAYKGSYNGTQEAMGAYYVSHVSKPLLTLKEKEISLENVSADFEVKVPYTGATIGISLPDTDWLSFKSQTTIEAEEADTAVFSFSVPVNMGDDRTAEVGFYSTSADGAVSNNVTLTIVQKGGFSVVYKKVSKVESGKTYLIVADGKYAAEALEESYSYGYLYPSSVEDKGGEISFYNPVCEFVITEAEGGYTIRDCYGRYLYQSGTFNTFNVTTDPEEGHIWKIEAQADGTFRIENISVGKYIQYSGSYESFGSYKDAQKNAFMPVLYEKTE